MAKYKAVINTSLLKPLTNEQNLELFKKLQIGAQFVIDELIKDNLK